MNASGDSTVPHLDICVDETNAEEAVIEIAKKVRPDWQDKDVKVKVFSGGISNKLLGCFIAENKNDILLSRIYGKKTELLIDRKREKETFAILYRAGCGPKLHASFNNGICYEFVPGVTLDEKTVTVEKIYKLVAKEMARMHSIKPNDGTVPRVEVFEKMRHFISLHPTHFENQERDKLFRTKIMSREALEAEVDLLESILTKLQSPVVFSHNDLLLGNVVYDAEKGKVCFIDYEYTMYNHLAFDIGNHFCEFVGIEEVDYNLYPEKDFQLKWLRCYLQARYTILGENRAVTDREVQKLYPVVNKFALAAHLFWGLWAIVQAYYSTIDFDFLQYAIIRLDEYKRRKEEFLALESPE